MREIKFRAWDRDRGKFIGLDYPNNWGSDRDEWYADIRYQDLIGITTISKNDDFVVEQFTGLRDKNGKDIYEGDILRFRHYCNYSHDEDPLTDAVVWGDTGDSDGYSHKKHIEWVCGEDSLADISGEWCEIIGNIHEHTNLLDADLAKDRK